MSRAPRFSIVIPTRNRARLLRLALRTATNQIFDDFEIVVSNNCSSDETEAVIGEFAQPRLRTVRPDSSLSMPDHWEFALSQARGEYVTFLCDDDAMTPDALQQTDDAIVETSSRLLAAPYVAYYAPDWRDASQRNALLTFRFDGSHQTFDSRETLRGIFSCRTSFWTPRMLNSFAHKEVLQRAKAMVGTLFLQSPDYSFAVFSMNAVDSWTLVNRPLRLFGQVNESVGATVSYNRDEKVLGEFLAAFQGEDILRQAPLRLPLVANYISAALLLAKERVGAKMAGIDIDRASYFHENWRDIELLSSHGVDTTRDRSRFQEALAAETAELRREVGGLIEKDRQQTWKSRLLPQDSWLRRRAFQLGLAGSVFLRGDEWGFRDIAEAASWIAKGESLGLR